MGGCDCALDGVAPSSVNANPDVAGLGVCYIVYLSTALLIAYTGPDILPLRSLCYVPRDSNRILL